MRERATAGGPAAALLLGSFHSAIRNPQSAIWSGGWRARDHPAEKRGRHQPCRPRLEGGHRIVVEEDGVLGTQHALRTVAAAAAYRALLEVPHVDRVSVHGERGGFYQRAKHILGSSCPVR